MRPSNESENASHHTNILVELIRLAAKIQIIGSDPIRAINLVYDHPYLKLILSTRLGAKHH